MEIIRMQTHMLSQKIIANVSEEFARVYKLPKGHQSVGFFSVDNDDAGYLAVDDATKKADIKVIHAETFYGGSLCSWSRYGGSVFVMFSGPKVADVKSGLAYVKDFIDNRTELCNFDGDKGTAFYAQCVPRSGKFFEEFCGIPEGTAYAYLVGGPGRPGLPGTGIRRPMLTPAARYWREPSRPAGRLQRLLWTGCAMPSNTRWKCKIAR